MSDFTNDMRYPKRGSIIFDTKDRIDIIISKTDGDRSMNIVYSDPETGEIIQTSEGGGSIPNEKLFVFGGTDIMSEDCLKYGSEPTSTGRQADAYLGYNHNLHLTENEVFNATIKVGGQQYTSSGTVTKEDSGICWLAFSFNDDAFGVNIDEYPDTGVIIEIAGEGISADVSHTYAPTIAEAIEELATAWQALELVITVASEEVEPAGE